MSDLIAPAVDSGGLPEPGHQRQRSFGRHLRLPKLATVLCATAALLCPLPLTVAGEAPVILWRTPVRESGICTLSGRELAFPEQSPHPGRTWAGLISTTDESLRRELSRRHRLESDSLMPAWRQELRGSESAPEIDQRLKHSHRFEQAFVDVVIIQSADLSQLRWYIDDNFDGILQLQGSISVPPSDGPQLVPNDCLRLSLVTRGQHGMITDAGPPEIAPASSITRSADKSPQPQSTRIDRLTAQLQTLDHAAVRKLHLTEIDAAADQLIQLIERRHGPTSPHLADVLYRKGRALGYRELPDVVAVSPIEDPEALHQEFEATFTRLRSLVDIRQPDYILLAIRRERRLGFRGKALELLEIYRSTHPAPAWYHKKRSDLLRELQLSTAAHQAAAELWLHGQRPVQPVPVIVRCDSRPEPLTIHPSWHASPPWRGGSLTLTSHAPSVMEAVAWLPVNRTFEIHGDQMQTAKFTTDADFVQSGAVIPLRHRRRDDSSTKADSR